MIEINYIIKLFYNNYILKENNLLKSLNIENIIFTKILTKYSSEYNNYIFIYNLLQYFLIDKKDIFTFFSNCNIDNINILCDNLKYYDISKLEIIRIIKLINKFINYKIKKDISYYEIDNIISYDG